MYFYLYQPENTCPFTALDLSWRKSSVLATERTMMSRTWKTELDTAAFYSDRLHSSRSVNQRYGFSSSVGPLARALRWALSETYYHFACLSVCLSVCLFVLCPRPFTHFRLTFDRFGWNLAVRTHLGSDSLLWSFSHRRPLAAELWTINLIFRGEGHAKCFSYSS